MTAVDQSGPFHSQTKTSEMYSRPAVRT